MATLHVDSIGSGTPLLLIHGWGMHGGVWSEVAQKLAADFRVHSVDLPGYGKSSMIHLPPKREMAIAPSGETTSHSTRLSDYASQVAGYPSRGGLGWGNALAENEPPSLALPRGERGMDLLDVVVDELSARFPEPLSVCGWSMGGQVALRWAGCEPDKLQRLILVASTPCFTKREDWEFGMESEVLENFAIELEQNHTATLRRFIALQLRGSENERSLLALMRERLFSRGEPDMDALRDGLKHLRDTDMREELQGIAQPTLVIAGGRDKLTPPGASQYLGRVMPAARVVEVEGAAHAPFLSHSEIFVEQIKQFLHE